MRSPANHHGGGPRRPQQLTGRRRSCTPWPLLAPSLSLLLALLCRCQAQDERELQWGDAHGEAQNEGLRARELLVKRAPPYRRFPRRVIQGAGTGQCYRTPSGHHQPDADCSALFPLKGAPPPPKKPPPMPPPPPPLAHSGGASPAVPAVTPQQYPHFNPSSRYVSDVSIDPVTGKINFNLKESADWREYITWASNQDDPKPCGSCWAYTAALAVEGAYSMLGLTRYALESERQVGPSAQQLLDCVTGASCSGGSLADAFDYMASSSTKMIDEDIYDSYQGAKGKCHPSDFSGGDFWRISAFEQVPYPGILGLMLVLQYQPVAVRIRGSWPSFQNYVWSEQQWYYSDPACYDPSDALLDHTVLVVGYSYSTSSTSYFVIRNSWGSNWGEQGDARLLMDGTSYGTCGITADLGLYPVVSYTSLKADSRDPCTTNSCGTANQCQTTPGAKQAVGGPSPGDSNAPPPSSPPSAPPPSAPPPSAPPPSAPFVFGLKGLGAPAPAPVSGPSRGPAYLCICNETLGYTYGVNRDGTHSCIFKEQCSLYSVNPCGVGRCQNDGYGDYTCVCPSGYTQGELADSTTTCTADTSSSGKTFQYTIQAGDTCYNIYTTFGLTLAQFTAQNPTLDCSNLVPGTAISVKPDSSYVGCIARYPVSHADVALGKCTLIEQLFPGLQLSKLNPGLQCSALTYGQQICIESGVLSAANASFLCTQYVTPNDTDTCTSILTQYKLTYRQFYELNPGFQCDAINPALGQQICVQGIPEGSIRCVAPKKPYGVKRGDSCISIVATKFGGRVRQMGFYNNGWVCSPASLRVGLVLCTP